MEMLIYLLGAREKLFRNIIFWNNCSYKTVKKKGVEGTSFALMLGHLNKAMSRLVSNCIYDCFSGNSLSFSVIN